MPIYEFGQNGIIPIPKTGFIESGLHERRDLQRLIRENVEIIAPDTLIISEEFKDWEDSKRRIDLLAVDKDANLVVIELKRTEDGGHMDLQSIRYASMVSTLTFEKATAVFEQYLSKIGKEDQDPSAIMLDFLGWDAPNEDNFAQDVRIVLASVDFSTEITSCVLWLRDHKIDIRCVRLTPYNLDGRILVDAQQIIPVPEAEDYQIKLRQKNLTEREARISNADFTKFDVQIASEEHPRQWKRNAIFLICKHLCESGINPTEITALFDWRPNRVWYAVDGEVDAEAFQSWPRKRQNSTN